jgi:hypothetical protein
LAFHLHRLKKLPHPTVQSKNALRRAPRMLEDGATVIAKMKCRAEGVLAELSEARSPIVRHALAAIKPAITSQPPRHLGGGRSSRFPRTDRVYIWLCQTNIAPSLLCEKLQQLRFVSINSSHGGVSKIVLKRFVQYSNFLTKTLTRVPNIANTTHRQGVSRFYSADPRHHRGNTAQLRVDRALKKFEPAC